MDDVLELHCSDASWTRNADWVPDPAKMCPPELTAV